VAAGGTLSVGNGTDSLTIGNNLTLNSSSTTVLQVQHSPLNNSSVSVGNNLVFGGALAVTNTGGSAFTAGDSFKLFSAAGCAGTFSSVSLPALNPGLFWSTSRLTVDGTLGVVSSNAPAITSVGISDSSLVLNGTGGTPNWPYTILSSTNLALTLAQWTATATNFFDATGNFTWTNPASFNGSQQFYVLKVQ
jgi:hypothetical protein